MFASEDRSLGCARGHWVALLLERQCTDDEPILRVILMPHGFWPPRDNVSASGVIFLGGFSSAGNRRVGGEGGELSLR